MQFKINSTIQGAALNLWPDFHILFPWVFCVVPFVLVALLPAVLTAGGVWKEAPRTIRNIALVFLGSIAAWLAINKSQLPLAYHFSYPTKSIFMAMFYSWPKLPTYLRITLLPLLCAISFYYYKRDFLYLGTPLRNVERTYAGGVQPNGIVAVESLYFARLYRPGQTLDLGVVRVEKSLERYRAAIPSYA